VTIEIPAASNNGLELKPMLPVTSLPTPHPASISAAWTPAPPAEVAPGLGTTRMSSLSESTVRKLRHLPKVGAMLSLMLFPFVVKAIFKAHL
jgi:hypothetical protein